MNKLQELRDFANSTSPIERERIEFSRSLLTWLGESLWLGHKEVTHEDVVTLMMGTFYDLKGDAEDLFEKLPQELRKRNVLVASHSIGVLLSCGYSDFQYLKDAFNICLFLDYKMCFEMWDTKEKSYLLNVYSSKDKDAVNSKYVEENITIYKDKLLEVLKIDKSYISTLKVLEFYCEKLDGSGAPLGINYNNLSDLELSIISLLSLIGKTERESFRNNASEFYKKMSDSKEGLVSNRIIEYLKQSFERESQVGFLKVAGL